MRPSWDEYFMEIAEVVKKEIYMYKKTGWSYNCKR